MAVHTNCNYPFHQHVGMLSVRQAPNSHTDDQLSTVTGRTESDQQKQITAKQAATLSATRRLRLPASCSSICTHAAASTASFRITPPSLQGACSLIDCGLQFRLTRKTGLHFR